MLHEIRPLRVIFKTSVAGADTTAGGATGRGRPMRSALLRGKTLTLPILQGGMGVGVSLPASAAVAACGGMGTVSTAVPGFAEPDFATDPNGANLRALARGAAAKQLAGMRHGGHQRHGGHHPVRR